MCLSFRKCYKRGNKLKAGRIAFGTGGWGCNQEACAKLDRNTRILCSLQELSRCLGGTPKKSTLQRTDKIVSSAWIAFINIVASTVQQLFEINVKIGCFVSLSYSRRATCHTVFDSPRAIVALHNKENRFKLSGWVLQVQ